MLSYWAASNNEDAWAKELRGADNIIKTVEDIIFQDGNEYTAADDLRA